MRWWLEIKFVLEGEKWRGEAHLSVATKLTIMRYVLTNTVLRNLRSAQLFTVCYRNTGLFVKCSTPCIEASFMKKPKNALVILYVVY